MSANKNVLFITAHPDDLAFNMGGTARLLQVAGYDLHSWCISSGDRGYSGSGPVPPHSPELGAQRQAEEKASANLIDAELRFFGQHDGEVFASELLCREVAAGISALQPRAILTMGPYEKPDHAACFHIARHGLHLSQRFWETEFYTNLVIGESHNAFNPNVFVNTEAVIEHKKQQCFCHQHHLHDESYWDILHDRDKAHGKFASCTTAEAYFSELSLMATRWNRPAPCLLLELS